MSDGEYLPAAIARAQENPNGDLDAIQAKADADAELQRAAKACAEENAETPPAADLEALREAELDAIFGNLDEQLSQAEADDRAQKRADGDRIRASSGGFEPSDTASDFEDIERLGRGFFRPMSFEEEGAHPRPPSFDPREHDIFAMVAPIGDGSIQRTFWMGPKELVELLHIMPAATYLRRALFRYRNYGERVFRRL